MKLSSKIIHTVTVNKGTMIPFHSTFDNTNVFLQVHNIQMDINI